RRHGNAANEGAQTCGSHRRYLPSGFCYAAVDRMLAIDCYTAIADRAQIAHKPPSELVTITQLKYTATTVGNLAWPAKLPTRGFSRSHCCYRMFARPPRPRTTGECSRNGRP